MYGLRILLRATVQAKQILGKLRKLGGVQSLDLAEGWTRFMV